MTKEYSKDEMIIAFDEAYERLIAAANAAVERGVLVREGEWGPREVLAHIAGWGVEATERLPRVLAGAPALVYDDNAFNAAIITMLGDQSYVQVRNLLQQTHQHFVHMLHAQDESVFTPGNPVYERVKAVIQHHLQHVEELDAWA
ncbi:MAG TPA: DinB family protein [Ktedonobacteraceae bacterium]|nr:DinB family protein [Ktedonobacteraceae bacterium]